MLEELNITTCSILTALDGLENYTALENLYMNDCNERYKFSKEV